MKYRLKIQCTEYFQNNFKILLILPPNKMYFNKWFIFNFKYLIIFGYCVKNIILYHFHFTQNTLTISYCSNIGKFDFICIIFQNLGLDNYINNNPTKGMNANKQRCVFFFPMQCTLLPRVVSIYRIKQPLTMRYSFIFNSKLELPPFSITTQMYYWTWLYTFKYSIEYFIYK